MMSRRTGQYIVTFLLLLMAVNAVAAANPGYGLHANAPHANGLNRDAAAQAIFASDSLSAASFHDESHTAHTVSADCTPEDSSACTPADLQGVCLDDCESFCSFCQSPFVSTALLLLYQKIPLATSGPNTCPLDGHIAFVQRPPIPAFPAVTSRRQS